MELHNKILELIKNNNSAYDDIVWELEELFSEQEIKNGIEKLIKDNEIYHCIYSDSFFVVWKVLTSADSYNNEDKNLSA